MLSGFFYYPSLVGVLSCATGFGVWASDGVVFSDIRFGYDASLLGCVGASCGGTSFEVSSDLTYEA